MHGGSLGADSVDGVVGEEVVQQVDTLGVERGHDFGELLAVPLGETGLEVGQVDDVRPYGLCRRAERAEDLENLVDLAVAREDGLAVAHFGKDAADRPDVDACAVLFPAEEHFGGTVPQGDDLVCIGPERHAEGSGKTKIAQLQVPVAVDQQVLRLEISM